MVQLAMFIVSRITEYKLDVTLNFLKSYPNNVNLVLVHRVSFNTN